MNPVRHGANAITVGDVDLLLTVTSSGTAVHLTRPAEPHSTGRGAVHEFYFDASNRRIKTLEHNYDRTALLEPRWASATLWGREWAVMIAGEGGSFDDLNDEVAYAPTCRRCLALMDSLFPAPPPDPRLSLVVSLVADSILERGHAELRGVPGDQHDAVRKAVRTLVRQRTGQNCRSYVRETMILFDSEAIYAEHAEDNMRAAAQAIDRALAGDPTPIQEQPWRISWDTWNIS